MSAKENLGLDETMSLLAAKVFLVQQTTTDKKPEKTMVESITKRTYSERFSG